MRRVLANCCFAWFACKLAAVYLPQAASVLLAALFISLIGVSICRRWWDYRFLLPIAGLAALVSTGLAYAFSTGPILALTGQRLAVRMVAEQVASGFQDGTVRAEFQITHIQDVTLLPHERFYVSITAFPECEQGDIFTAQLTFQELERDTYYYSNLANRVFLQAQAQEVEWQGSDGSLRFTMARLQQSLAAKCRRYLPDKEGGILAAMALGEESHLSSEVKYAYQMAGITHLLVVSGQHLTLIGGIFTGSKPHSGQWRRLRALLAVAAVWFFMALNGFAPSITRAGIGAIIFYIGVCFFLPADGLTSLGIASVLLSLTGSHSVCDLGLQLSLAATLGVLLSVEAMRSFTAYELREEQPLRYWAARGVQVLLVPVFCAVFTLPVQLWAGLPVSGVSILANLLVLPFVGSVVVLGLLGALCGLIPWFDHGLRACALLAGLLIRIVNWIVDWVNQLPGTQIPLPREYSLWVFAVLALLVWLAVCRQKPVWLVAVPALLAVSVLVYQPLMQNTMELAVVGSASNPCAVVLYENKAAVLFRGGESNRRAVVEKLEQWGNPEVICWADLRKEPEEMDLPTQQVVYAQQLPPEQEQVLPLGAETTLHIVHGNGANLALLEVQGYRIALCAGQLEAATPLQVDLLIAGSTLPERIEPQVIAGKGLYDWLDEEEADSYAFYYMPVGGSVFIRPGRSVQFRGVVDVTQ